MEFFRNVEPVLMLCFGLLCAAVALAYKPQAPAAASETAVSASWLTTQVVVIRAKRLSPSEKAELPG